MQMYIYDLIESQIDKLITQDSDIYGRVLGPGLAMDEPNRDPSIPPTVNLIFNVRTVAVDDNHIIMEFPNGNIIAVPISSINYHKIEVM